MKSIMQTEAEQDYCYICGNIATDLHHCWHGYANRKLADRDGLTVMLCRKCHMYLHDKGKFDKELQKAAEERWIEHNQKTEDDFRKRYGKSVL
ncbi:hypothetical protein [Butyrivibrio virus Ceridwen]|nr:hypothetical protein [Butyrivibrio virus Ceridwen]